MGFSVPQSETWNCVMLLRWVWVRKTSVCWWRSCWRTSGREVKNTAWTSGDRWLKVTLLSVHDGKSQRNSWGFTCALTQVLYKTSQPLSSGVNLVKFTNQTINRIRFLLTGFPPQRRRNLLSSRPRWCLYRWNLTVCWPPPTEVWRRTRSIFSSTLKSKRYEIWKCCEKFEPHFFSVHLSVNPKIKPNSSTAWSLWHVTVAASMIRNHSSWLTHKLHKLLTLFRFLLNMAAFCQPASQQVSYSSGSVRCFLCKVLLTLKKPREQKELPFLVFQIAQLGIDTKVRKYDMCATTYIKKITMKCLEFKGQSPSAHHDWAIITFPLCVKADDDQLLILHPAVFSFVSQLVPGRQEAANQTETCAAALSMTWCFWFLGVSDSSGEPLCLISSSVQSGAELLKVQYCKVMTSLSHFSTDNLFRW